MDGIKAQVEKLQPMQSAEFSGDFSSESIGRETDSLKKCQVRQSG
jgi:hypothetical protein